MDIRIDIKGKKTTTTELSNNQTLKKLFILWFKTICK